MFSLKTGVGITTVGAYLISCQHTLSPLWIAIGDIEPLAGKSTQILPPYAQKTMTQHNEATYCFI